MRSVARQVSHLVLPSLRSGRMRNCAALVPDFPSLRFGENQALERTPPSGEAAQFRISDMIIKIIFGLIYTRRFVIASFLSFLLTLGYLISLTLQGDPRMIDNVLSGEEMYWWEAVIFWQGLVMIFGLFFSAVYHSFVLLNKKLWGVVILFLWPLTFVYAWLHYPKQLKN